MIKYFAFLLIILTFYVNNSNAENVSEIRIEGNKRISNETIKVYGNISIGKI